MTDAIDPLMSANARQKFYFVGVSTSQSAIQTLFPLWAQRLNLGACELCGADFPIDASPSAFREFVTELKLRPQALGALITTHKIALFDAAEDLFDVIDDQAARLREAGCLYKRDGKLHAQATDVESSGFAMQAFIDDAHWQRCPQAELLCLGAGGAGVAISDSWLRRDGLDRGPQRIELCDVRGDRLAAARELLTVDPAQRSMIFTQLSDTEPADALLEGLPPGSLIVNATGMGKDRPGSPITAAAQFPSNALIWELNYRGERQFLQQANAQQAHRNLHIETGWRYFVYGWTRVMTRVFNRPIATDPNDPELADLIQLTMAYSRQQRPKSA